MAAQMNENKQLAIAFGTPLALLLGGIGFSSVENQRTTQPPASSVAAAHEDFGAMLSSEEGPSGDETEPAEAPAESEPSASTPDDLSAVETSVSGSDLADASALATAEDDMTTSDTESVEESAEDVSDLSPSDPSTDEIVASAPRPLPVRSEGTESAISSVAAEQTPVGTLSDPVESQDLVNSDLSPVSYEEGVEAPATIVADTEAQPVGLDSSETLSGVPLPSVSTLEDLPLDPAPADAPAVVAPAELAQVETVAAEATPVDEASLEIAAANAASADVPPVDPAPAAPPAAAGFNEVTEVESVLNQPQVGAREPSPSGVARSEPETSTGEEVSPAMKTSSPKTAAKPFLGVGVRNVSKTVVTSLHANSTAQVLGIQVGDELSTVNGASVKDLASLRTVLKQLAVGDEVQVTVLRQGRVVRLGPQPIRAK